MVTTAPPGSAFIGGTVTFSSTNSYANTTLQTCGTSGSVQVADVQATVGGISQNTAVANCTVVFPHVASPPGTFTVVANYSGDNNFSAYVNTGAKGTTSTVMVEDANISLTLTPTGSAADASKAATATTLAVDYVAQGFSNTTELFNGATITTSVEPAGGFSGSLSFTCTVVNTATQVPVTDPSCVLTPASQTATNGAYPPVAVALSASANAPLGEYTVSVQATGKSFPVLTSQSLDLFVLLVNGTMNLASGASGSTSAVFNTSNAPAGDSLVSFSCPSVLTPKGVAPSFVTTCKGPSTPVAASGSTSVPISVSFSAETTAALAHPAITIYAAAFAAPFLAVIAWFGSKKSGRRNFFRFLGMFLVMVGVASLIGCGGSFTGPNIPVNKTITPGAYYIEVVAQDSSGNSYYTVIPVLITAE
jgi:hypothetical protein